MKLLPLCFRLLLVSGTVLAPALTHSQTAAQEERTNAFGDPFVAITTGMPGCPVPLGPMYTAKEFTEEAHWRSQRGVSCHTAGRCRHQRTDGGHRGRATLSFKHFTIKKIAACAVFYWARGLKRYKNGLKMPFNQPCDYMPQ